MMRPRTRIVADFGVAALLLAALGAVYAIDQRRVVDPATDGTSLLAGGASEQQRQLEADASAVVDDRAKLEPDRRVEGELDLLDKKFAGDFTLNGHPAKPPELTGIASITPLPDPIKVNGIDRPPLKIIGNVPPATIISNPPPAVAINNQPQPPPPLIEPVVPKKPKEVVFFGTRVEAELIAFVVDCSNSMTGIKFERVRTELAKSIIELQPEQSFYVVFFNDGFISMLGPGVPPKLHKATAAAKSEVLQWLTTAFASGNTFPEPALMLAARLAPEKIYLLTDGNFSPLSAGAYQELASHSIKVHTLGFGADADPTALQFIANRTGGTYKYVEVDTGPPNLYLADVNVLRGALHNSSAEIRQLAVAVIFGRELPMMNELIDVLGDTDIALRKYIHEELVRVATGSDFGPSEDDLADAPQAIARWHLWSKMRTAATERMIATRLASKNLNERWVAAAIARQRGFRLPDELVKVVGDPTPGIRREARVALAELASPKDFGPEPDATPEEVAAAVAKWTQWRADELQAIAAAKAAAHEKRAGQLLALAQQMLKQDLKEGAQKKVQEIMRDFPASDAAMEAKKLLTP